MQNKPKRKPGRPTKATPELLQAILDDLSRGLTREQACAVNGVSDEQFSQWEKRPEYPGLRARAQATRIRALVQLKAIAGEKDWKSWAWDLERIFPDQFAKPSDSETNINLTQNNNTLNYNDAQSLEDARRALDEVRAIKDARRRTED
jgi:hypothetical protein